MVRRYLDDSCDTGIHIDKILSASSLEDLQKEARLENEKLNCITSGANKTHAKVVISILVTKDY